MKLLIHYEDSIDGMTFQGFFIENSDNWDQYRQNVHDYFKENDVFNYYVDGNIYIEYQTALELLETYTIKAVTDEDANTLIRLNLDCFGDTGPEV
jgi:hypothetical protein